MTLLDLTVQIRHTILLNGAKTLNIRGKYLIMNNANKFRLNASL